MRRFLAISALVLVAVLVFFYCYAGIKAGAVAVTGDVRGMFSGFTLGFIPKFLGLTAVFFGTTLAIFGVAARFRRQSILEYFDEIDEVFRIITLMLVVTFLIACFHEKGSALAMPAKYSAKGLNELGNLLTNLFWGSDMKTQFDGDHPSWITTGSWFWWQATGVYLVAWFVICWEALFHSLGAVWGVIQRYQAVRRAGAPHAAAPATGAAGHIATAIAGWAGLHIAFEAIVEFIQQFRARRRAARP